MQVQSPKSEFVELQQKVIDQELVEMPPEEVNDILRPMTEQEANEFLGGIGRLRTLQIYKLLKEKGDEKMSYDLGLYHDSKPVQVERHQEGGTYALGGITEAELNITYNYSWFFYRFFDKEKGIRWLYGKQAKDTVERLEFAVKELGAIKYSDYWAPTPGNAGHALLILLGWANQHPKAIWQGD